MSGRKPARHRKNPENKRENRVVLLFTDAEKRDLDDYIEQNGLDGYNHLGRELVLNAIRGESND